MARVEPERQLMRRALPLFPLVGFISFVLAAFISSLGAGVSAAVGIAVVAVNLVAHAYSLSWGARVSRTVFTAVACAGVIVRIALILAFMNALKAFSWFSPVAFGGAVIVCTVALLAFEMKQLSGRMQSELWSFDGPAAQ